MGLLGHFFYFAGQVQHPRDSLGVPDHQDRNHGTRRRVVHPINLQYFLILRTRKAQTARGVAPEVAYHPSKAAYMITPKLFNQVAQLGHFAGGSAIVLAIVVVSHQKWYAVWGFLVVAMLAGIKEFWYDEKYETAEVRGSSAEDFLFYLLGAGLAMLVSVNFG
jgi:hypothetical protein